VTRARGRHGRRRPLAGLTVAALAVALVAGTAALTWASGAIQGPASTSAASIQPRVVTGNPVVNTLLGRMSLAEKFRLLEWVTAPGQPQTATLPGLRRLGIPALHLAQGPVGTAHQPSAAMTAPLGVAATFSRADAYANGVLLGRDARALGQQAVARPFGAIGTGAAGNQPSASFGEDPLLVGGTAAAEIAGIQAQGTMAVTGDYPAGPDGPGVVPSSAALHEIYLQPVEDAVRAGAAGILCSPAPGVASTATAGTAPAGTAPAGPASPGTPPPGTPPPGTPPPGTPPPGTPPAGRAAGGTPTAPANPVATPGTATVPAAGAPTGSARAATPGTTAPTSRAAAPAGPAHAGPAHAPGAAGEHAGQAPCGNPGLLIQILRSELGFTGFVLAGPGANPGTLSLDSGLDGEVPAAAGTAARYFTPAALRAAIASKTITTATVDQAVAAVLTEMDRFGLLGPQPAHRTAAGPVAAGERVIARTATDAATLLRNTAHALPLTPAALSSLALIGPGADQVIGTGPAGDGAPGGTMTQPPGTLQVLRQDLAADPAADPAASLSFAVGDDMTGTPVPASVLTHEGQPGLVRSTGHGTARVVSALDSTLAGHDALPAGSGHTWAGELTAPATGSYWISLGTGGSWGTLTLDGTVVAQDGPGQPATGGAPVPATDGLENLRARVTLTAGIHTLGVSESPDGSGRPVQVRLNWVTPQQQQGNLAAAVATARAAKAAVVFAWSSGGSSLPDGQDQLIQDVAAVNPDTIVVLNTQGPVAMPWLSAVRSVLEMWYPGDGGGAATANVLLGRDDPAGRLPVTWPASPHRFRANQPTGIFVGYRRYDKDGIAPLFPFGYGMSYTRFGYSALNWHAVPGRGLVLRLRVTNTGTRPGTAVPQAYLGAPAAAPPGATFARRALAAYTRIGLRPGQSRVVTLTVPQRQLQYWQDARGWVTAPGRRRVFAGGDERATPLTTTVTIPR
jgi:beta-glucosidase